MKINEVCKPTKLDNGAEVCIVQFGPKRGFGTGAVDPKLADAAQAKQDAKDKEMWKQDDIEYEKFNRMAGHAKRNARRFKTKPVARPRQG